jgi:hypothetical protein
MFLSQSERPSFAWNRNYVLLLLQQQQQQ